MRINMPNKESVTVDGCVIDYNIVCSSRRTIGIVVKPDGRVEVRVPMRVSLSSVRDVVELRGSWIIRQRERFAAMGDRFVAKSYTDGESHPYLGHAYTLKIEIGRRESVNISADHIIIVCRETSRAEILLKTWYKQQALRHFAAIAEPIIRDFDSRHRRRPTSLCVRQMTSRWGSCTAKGKVTLSVELIKFRLPCIQYVIVHELCHLIHRNHASGFYNLLSAEIPDWQSFRHELNGR